MLVLTPYNIISIGFWIFGLWYIVFGNLTSISKRNFILRSDGWHMSYSVNNCWFIVHFYLAYNWFSFKLWLPLPSLFFIVSLLYTIMILYELGLSFIFYMNLCKIQYCILSSSICFQGFRSWHWSFILCGSNDPLFNLLIKIL